MKAARLLAEAEVVVYDDLGTEACPPRLCASRGARRPPVPALQDKDLQAHAVVDRTPQLTLGRASAQAAVSAHAPAAAELCYVGKRGGRPSARQADINALLVARCRAGRRVVRLKGGCPSVFGRASGELAALAAAGVPTELVPGVSSALAAPLAAGNPVT
jgi:siroheme synthase